MIYDLRDILLWIVRGWWQYFVLRHGLYRWLRLPERPTAPDFWLDYYTQYQWYHYLDSDGRPNHIIWASRYRTCATRAYSAWLGVQTRAAQDAAVSLVRGFTGSLLHGYVTFSDWIGAIRGRVGTYVPYWADHLAHAATRLFDWLPGDITAGLVSFYDKFVAWYEATKSWVRTNYDAAVTWASDAWGWVINTGWQLNNWWLGIRDFLDGFFHYHVAWVQSWLGDPWAKLVSFCTGALTFFYNLWGSYASEIGAFWDDPLMWLYDRVEDELIRRW